MNNTFSQGVLDRVAKWAIVLAVILVIFFAIKSVAEFKYLGTIGDDSSKTITVSGEGEEFAVPNIAEISFGVSLEGATVETAQKQVTDRMNAIHDALEEFGIEKKDIKTTNYSIYPRYEYETKQAVAPNGGVYYPQPGERVLKGYTVSNDVSIKIRKVDDAGKVLAELGSLKVTNLSGINFVVEDEDAAKAAARKTAIADAKDQARQLAKDLGVRLGKVVSFSESGNYPIYYKTASLESRDASVGGAPAPTIAPGENKITSNVTIVYEIR